MSDKHLHDHEHANDDENHQRPVADKKRMLWAVSMTISFMVVEVIGGLLSGSLALLADAGHMLTDSAALLLAFYAMHLSAKPADNKRTFGYGRLQVLAAYTNGLILAGLTVWIVWEAIMRFKEPQPIESVSMLVVASLGLLVNLIVYKILHSASEANINIRGALLHVLGDLLGSVGAIIAALIIWQWNLLWVDPLLSVFVSILILRSAYSLVKDSVHILLEGSPTNIQLEDIKQTLLEIEGVKDIHHMHLWSLSENEPMMTFHALTEGTKNHDQLIDIILEKLKREHGILHATIQVEQFGCSENGCLGQKNPQSTQEAIED